MTCFLLRLLAPLMMSLLFCFGCPAQSKSKKYERELFAEVANHEKLVAECVRKTREYQIAKFGRVLPRISLYCLDGCPVLLVRPYYLREARRFRISGQVKVVAISDETGKVIYARAVDKRPFLSQIAERAAYLSRYTPKKTCDDKPIKFRWTITYNFVLTR
jgi:hypothetical protein